MNEKFSRLIIESSATVLSALKQMDAAQHKLLIVAKDGKFESMFSIGDVQRAIIKGVDFNTSIESILREVNITIAKEDDDMDTIKELMRKKRIEFMPIINAEGNVKDVIFWKDIFDESENVSREPIDLPVVIMAGGKGTRLRPLTNVIPKPMVPIGDKTILEAIIDQFELIGCHKYYISVNFKVDILKYYMDNLDHKYDITYFQEDKPLGTIGSISLLKGKIETPFFVSNCDSLIDQDFRDVYDYHVENKNDLTIVTTVKSFKIPYGVLETGENGLMTGLLEKPELTYQINTGVYILNPKCINEIPEGKLFHITHLMEKIKSRGGRVGCFPVSEYAWRDMGEWPEYLKMIKVL